MLVQTIGHPLDHAIHIRLLEEIIDGTGNRWMFRKTKRNAGRTILKVVSAEGSSDNGSRLMAWAIERLAMLGHDFGPYVRGQFAPYSDAAD